MEARLAEAIVVGVTRTAVEIESDKLKGIVEETSTVVITVSIEVMGMNRGLELLGESVVLSSVVLGGSVVFSSVVSAKEANVIDDRGYSTWSWRADASPARVGSGMRSFLCPYYQLLIREYSTS